MAAARFSICLMQFSSQEDFTVTVGNEKSAFISARKSFIFFAAVGAQVSFSIKPILRPITADFFRWDKNCSILGNMFP